MKNIAVLFDMDGVIALTEYIKAEAHVATIEKLGGKASAELYLQMLGQSHEAIRFAFIKASGIVATPATYSNYSKMFRKIYNDLIDEKLEIRPGARNLVTELKKQGFLLGIVSSSSSSSITKILMTGGMKDDFDVVVSSEEVKEKKPNPEPYIFALKKLGTHADNTLVFEDSATGIEAARRAGIRVIGVRHEHNRNQNFNDAMTVLDSFLDTKAIVDIINTILGVCN